MKCEVGMIEKIIGAIPKVLYLLHLFIQMKQALILKTLARKDSQYDNITEKLESLVKMW